MVFITFYVKMCLFFCYNFKEVLVELIMNRFINIFAILCDLNAVFLVISLSLLPCEDCTFLY